MLRHRRERLKILQVVLKTATIFALVLLTAGCEDDEDTFIESLKQDAWIFPLTCVYPSSITYNSPIAVRASLPAGTTDAQCTTYSNPSFFEIKRNGTALGGFWSGGSSADPPLYQGYCRAGSSPLIHLFVTLEEPGEYSVKITLPGLQTFETIRNVIITGYGPTYNDIFCPGPIRPVFSDGLIETTLTP